MLVLRLLVLNSDKRGVQYPLNDNVEKTPSACDNFVIYFVSQKFASP